MNMNKPIILYGSNISYFTGKMENYFKVKEIPYSFKAMRFPSFKKTMIEKVQLEENFSSFRLLYSAVSIWTAMTLKQPNLGSYLLSHQYSLVYYAGEGRYAGLTGIKLMRYIRVRVGLEPSNLKNLDPICERLPRS